MEIQHMSCIRVIRVGGEMQTRRLEEWYGMAAFSCVSDYFGALTCRSSQPRFYIGVSSPAASQAA
jgi:hypothetical protein